MAVGSRQRPPLARPIAPLVIVESTPNSRKSRSVEVVGGMRCSAPRAIWPFAFRGGRVYLCARLKTANGNSGVTLPGTR